MARSSLLGARNPEEQLKQFLGLVSFDVTPEHLRALGGERRERERERVLVGLKPKPKPIMIEDALAQSYWGPSVDGGSNRSLVRHLKVKQKPRANKKTSGRCEVQAEQAEDVHPTSSAGSDNGSTPIIPLSLEPYRASTTCFSLNSKDVEKPMKNGLLCWRRFVGLVP